MCNIEVRHLSIDFVYHIHWNYNTMFCFLINILFDTNNRHSSVQKSTNKNFKKKQIFKRKIRTIEHDSVALLRYTREWLHCFVINEQVPIIQERFVNAGNGGVTRELHRSWLQQNWYDELRQIEAGIKSRLM